MTDATDLLLNLKDIHEPIAPATSSALVLGLSILLSVLILCCVAGYWFWRRKALNRALQKELDLIANDKNEAALQRLAALLRRVMHHLHGDSINHLQNKQWLDALDATFATNYFSKGRGSIFGESLYRPIDLAQPETCPDTQQLNNDLQKLIGRTKLRLRT